MVYSYIREFLDESVCEWVGMRFYITLFILFIFDFLSHYLDVEIF